jgi:hypothetical protein
MARVSVVHDPAQEVAPGQPRAESARVTVIGERGGPHEAYVPFVLGYPSHPLDKGGVEAKPSNS